MFSNSINNINNIIFILSHIAYRKDQFICPVMVGVDTLEEVNKKLVKEYNDFL